MSKCPKCKEEINDLISVESAKIVQRFSLVKYRGENSPEYHDVSRDFEGNPEFFCPECDKVLFTDEDEAIKFFEEKVD